MKKGLSRDQQKVVDLLSRNIQPYGLVDISMNTLKALVRKGVIREKRNPHFRHPIYELIERVERELTPDLVYYLAKLVKQDGGEDCDLYTLLMEIYDTCNNDDDIVVIRVESE